MKLQTRIKRYKLETIALVGLIVALIADSPNIGSRFEASASLRATADAQNQKFMKMKLSQQASADASEIAKERYETGCLVVLSKKDDSQYASIIEGKPVKDKSNSMIPQNTIVCDGYGNTAKIALIGNIPVATEVAFTGDRKIIAKARKFESAAYSSD